MVNELVPLAYMAHRRRYLTTTELAKMLGISRIAVFKRIQSGKLRAERVGRAYRIRQTDFPALLGATITPARRRVLDAAVHRVVREYGETLKLLGKE